MAYPDFGERWRKRWVQINTDVLHRVASTVTPTPENKERYLGEIRSMYRGFGIDKEPDHEIDDWEVDGMVPVGIQGVTACGRTGRLTMPGLFSRMGAPRCRFCCRKTGVPFGDGAPFNDNSLPKDVQQL